MGHEDAHSTAHLRCRFCFQLVNGGNSRRKYQDSKLHPSTRRDEASDWRGAVSGKPSESFYNAFMWNHAALTSLLLPAILIGQVGSVDRTITVSASRSATVTPDQALFGVYVFSPTDSSRDEVLAALQGSGITAANFTGVYTTTQFVTGKSQEFLQWSFTIIAPLSNLKNTVGQLSALQQIVAQKKNGMTVSFSVRGTQASAQALAAQNCAATDLVADARAQAQKMASAAGAAVGAVVAVSGSSIATPAADALFAAPTYQPSCTLTVKFALTGF